MPTPITENVSNEITRWAQIRPEGRAIHDGEKTLSFLELENAIKSAQYELEKLGCKRGELVLAVGENSIGFAVFLLAAARMCMHVILENARRASPEIHKIIDHSQPAFQFYFHGNSSDCLGHSTFFKASIRHSSIFGDYGFIRGHDSNSSLVDANVFAIIYTTGTTGTPKGVMLTHSNFLFIAMMMQQLREIEPDDQVLAILPISHVMGFASVFLGALYSGATVYFLPKFSSEKCLELIIKNQITVLQGAPIMFAKLVDFVRSNKLTVSSSLRFLGSGGAPIDKNLKKDVNSIFQCDLQNGYGLTEMPSISWTRFEDAVLDDSVGLPLPGVDIQFRNAAGALCDISEVGELWARGPNLMIGYFKSPELTNKVMDKDGWFNTQDLGYVNHTGALYIVGRTSDVIIRSGFKVYPLEVESVLLAHPHILHAAVVGHSISANEEVWAFIERDKEYSLNADEVSSFLSAQLSPYKRPSRIIFMESLPLAANGKVLKSKLMDQFTQ
jgi:acyl-CoA synthetase (AMP-forming)/AMP-acid ligase II